MGSISTLSSSSAIGNQVNNNASAQEASSSPSTTAQPLADFADLKTKVGQALHEFGDPKGSTDTIREGYNAAKELRQRQTLTRETRRDCDALIEKFESRQRDILTPPLARESSGVSTRASAHVSLPATTSASSSSVGGGSATAAQADGSTMATISAVPPFDPSWEVDIDSLEAEASGDQAEASAQQQKTKLRQDEHTLVSADAASMELPENWEERAEDALQKLPEHSKAQKEPVKIRGFGPVQGNTAAIQKAEQLCVELHGFAQHGQITDHEEDIIEKHPDVVNYEGMRTPQVLSQISEIANSAAERAGIKAVEIQFGCAVTPKGETHLFASANTPAAQVWLQENLGNTKKLLQDALHDETNPHAQRVAWKVLFDAEHQKERAKANHENPDDQRRASEIVRLFLNDNVTVVLNDGKNGETMNVNPKLKDKTVRHAEQNILMAMLRSKADYESCEIQGTKIRCGSCVATIGPNYVSGARFMSGKIYLSQAKAEDLIAFLEQLQNGEATLSDKDDSARPASSSPGLPVQQRNSDDVAMDDSSALMADEDDAPVRTDTSASSSSASPQTSATAKTTVSASTSSASTQSITSAHVTRAETKRKAMSPPSSETRQQTASMDTSSTSSRSSRATAPVLKAKRYVTRSQDSDAVQATSTSDTSATTQDATRDPKRQRH